MARPVILGLDLATQVGWCAGDGGSLPVSDSFRIPATGSDLGWYGDEARTYFRILLERFRPQVVLYESPITMPNQNPDVTTKLHAMPMLTEMAVRDFDRSIEVRKVYPVTIKAQVAGSGRAGKEEVMAAVRRAGMKPKNKDESDACGAWLCGVREYSPALWAMWSARLKGLGELP